MFREESLYSELVSRRYKDSVGFISVTMVLE